MCDVSCAEGYILSLPQKHNVIGVQVLFYFIVILKLNTVHRLKEARLMCTNNHTLFSHPPLVDIWLHVCLVQHNLLLFKYSLNDEQTGRLCIPASPGINALDHFQCIACLCLCHIIIQSCPTCPLSSLPVVPKGGG